MTAAGALGATSLLAGPRGRRLCLEVATALNPDVRAAAFYASYALDPGAGASRVMFSLAPGGGDPPTASADDVATALATARWPALREPDLMGAFDHAMASARYWQEPDGEDVLAATPRVRDALTPVAELIATSPHIAWWSEPVDRSTQRSVVWHDADGPRSARDGGVAELDAWRADVVAGEAAARRDRPTDPTANLSGAWWSTPPWLTPRTTRDLGARGPVGLWLVEDSAGWRRAEVRAVAVDPGARVLEVDGPAAWADLCRRHPLEVTASRRHDWYRTTGRGQGEWVQPDWAALARECDGVHLSVAGYLTTAGRAVPVADGVASVLAGWDPDATFWLTGASGASGASAGAGGDRAHVWEYDEDSEAWRRP
ncbi:hypothetical protein [Xylanimonas ulmi]|uniref:Uncharacterized protein n=1 Tax=Xylanimonas ulmi TaxID=228973 RepID=A0A4Q7M1J4_9MICO|nr:hypothetical protein [Xylanibacterium ulmi]RZS61111.1 hypothetical protein EV386_1399 [Xylanibacterium ulmi]